MVLWLVVVMTLQSEFGVDTHLVKAEIYDHILINFNKLRLICV